MLKEVKLYVPKSVRILQPTASQQYATYIQTSLKQLIPGVRQEAEISTPEWQGDLRESITVEALPGPSLKVEWTSPLAAVVEKGSRPHWAPLAPLYVWSYDTLPDVDDDTPWRIQAWIAKHGTKGAKYLSKARSAIYKYVTPAWRNQMKFLGKFLAGDFNQ